MPTALVSGACRLSLRGVDCSAQAIDARQTPPHMQQGALLFAPFGMPTLLREAPTWSPRAWWLVAYILAMPTIVAYSCNAWALGRSSPTLVTVYIYLQPIISALLAWLQLGQHISSQLAVAASLILTGVGIVSTRKMSAPAAAKS